MTGRRRRATQGDIKGVFALLNGVFGTAPKPQAHATQANTDTSTTGNKTSNNARTWQRK